MGILKRLFGYKKALVDKVWNAGTSDAYYRAGYTEYVAVPAQDHSGEYVVEPVANRTKPRKAKKLNKGLVKRTTAAKPAKKRK